jgi:hypothetical protein
MATTGNGVIPASPPANMSRGAVVIPFGVFDADKEMTEQRRAIDSLLTSVTEDLRIGGTPWLGRIKPVR